MSGATVDAGARRDVTSDATISVAVYRLKGKTQPATAQRTERAWN